MRKILKCEKCNTYTLKEICPKCGSKSLIVNPPKYSPEDKYGSYRRKVKISVYKEHGLI
ncbi:MAG: RNA-protein complex protein Nop10 [Nanoarchaeota archaeon]